MLLGHPSLHARPQDIGRQSAASQNLVVERPEIECGAQLLRGGVAQLFDLQLADLVAEGSPGPDDVPVHFHNEFVLGENCSLRDEPISPRFPVLGPLRTRDYASSVLIVRARVHARLGRVGPELMNVATQFTSERNAVVKSKGEKQFSGRTLTMVLSPRF